jgi:hypothetical protein
MLSFMTGQPTSQTVTTTQPDDSFFELIGSVAGAKI